MPETIPSPTTQTNPDGFADLLARYDAAVEQGEQEALDSVYQHLEERAAKAIHGGDIPDMMRLRSQLRRLERRATRGTPHAFLEGTLITFTVLDRMLAAGRTAAELQASSELRAQTTLVLRDAVLDELRLRPQRPADLARALNTGAPQISRVIRVLTDEGLVEPTESPDGSSDQRARWYRPAA